MTLEDFKINGTKITDYKGSDSELTIPAGITEISFSAFSKHAELKSIYIPETVTEIGSYAFQNCTNLENIVIPETVTRLGNCAFENCPLLQDKNGFVIINGTVFDYFGNAEELTVPEGISVISGKAFENCISLKHVVLPDTVTKLEEAAFRRCANLVSIRIPASVKEIGASVFDGCENLEEIGSPVGVQSIEYSGGFKSCEKLADNDGRIIVNNHLIQYIGNQKEVTIPDNIEVICGNAFSFSKALNCVTIPGSVKKIESSAFQFCRSLKTVKMNGPIEVDEDYLFSECPLDVRTFSETDILWFYLNISKVKAVKECEKRIVSDLDANIRTMMTMLDGRDSDKQILRMTKLIVKYQQLLSDHTRELMQAFFERNNTKQAVKLLVKNNIIKGDSKTEAKKLEKEMKQKAARDAEQTEDAVKLKNHERPDEKEVENYVSKLNERIPLLGDLNYTLKKQIYYRNSHIPVQGKVLKMILTIYAKEFADKATLVYGDMNNHYELTSGSLISISKEADYIYSFIDPDGFDEFLMQQINSQQYRDYVLSFARFATEKHVKDVISQVKTRKKGKAKDKYWANNIEKSLIISDTLAAMNYYESIRKLDEYASKRNMTVQELRDTAMIPDFGFDQNGIKKYQCGDLNLNITVRPDLKLTIFDCNKGKELKSIPSKVSNADKEDIILLKEDYKKFSKDVMNYGKEKLQNIKQLHISGISISKDTWIKVYVDHPVIKNLSEGIVWSDGEKYFIPTANGIKDVKEDQYEPIGKVKVANVLDMDPAEIDEWQNYIIAHHIKQPFEQMWEPAFDLNKYHGTKEFAGLTLTNSERNAMKKNLKDKGIEVYSDELSSFYDHRAGKYIFNDHNTMHFGSYANVVYLINDDKSITFDNIRFRKDTNRNAMNTILFSLHKILVEQIIVSDFNDKLSREELDLFTLAQILSFINIAEDNKSVRCKAVLLDYKNEKYPEYNALDDLILEL